MPYGVTRTTLRSMTNIPPPAEELRILDHELRQLDARRTQLLARRAWLLGVLRSAEAPAPAWGPARASAQTPAIWAAPAPHPRRSEATAPGVQNVLLVLGGVLLTVAAIAFTLVSWGHLGIAGRAAVLGAVTFAALAAPVPLLKRGLSSTAESVAGLGLVLTVLDAYALHEVALPEVDGTGYAAAATALLAVLWAAYGRSLGALRLPLPAAMATAQLPLLLWLVAVDAGHHTITAALLVTAAFDTVVALSVPVRSVRVVATVGAYGTGAWGVLAAGWLSWEATGPSAATRAAALLALAAAIALGAAWRAPAAQAASGLSLTGGLITVAAAGGVLRSVLPDAWTVPGHLLCGVALLAVRGTWLPESVHRGLRWSSAGVQAVAVAWALPLVTVVLVGPVGWAERVWSGAPSDARDAVTVSTPWPSNTETAPLVLAAVAAVLVLTFRGGPHRSVALSGALGLAWAAVLVLPATLELPYLAGLLMLGVTTAATLTAAAYSRHAHVSDDGQPARQTEPPARPRHSPITLTALGLALLTSLHLVVLSLAAEGATLAVLGSLTALFAAVAAWQKHEIRAVSAAASLAYATALACATGASLDWQPHHIALLVLVVPATAALLAARLKDSTSTLSVEITGAVAALLAIDLAAMEPPVLALVLALCGVIAAGTAVRPDRRQVGYAAAALFVLATWVRLASWEVGSPEAYTLPVTVPALVVGFVRRRRDPGTSSWTAYGPGLSVTLLPSLLAAWGDLDWPRPLLLGSAALLVTLVGARQRLQALLVLGGGTLALVALHELAPYIAQAMGAVPRWVPPALAGLLLLALGATYEQRLRDARRVREVLGRMH
ncbi:SCO7613 C-terminal domain-containing membrane protein [Streptomyces phaeochromogenes]|uniref:SCO7613 C-terminal domain-containing membrane protein n=1 Tax=Streptomyces phaeochromogenes TaxID=1923 RepID=UPI0036A8E569